MLHSFVQVNELLIISLTFLSMKGHLVPMLIYGLCNKRFIVLYIGVAQITFKVLCDICGVIIVLLSIRLLLNINYIISILL